MRGAGGLPDLTAGTEAGVRSVGGDERIDHKPVAVEPFALTDHVAVPVEADGSEVTQLAGGMLLGRVGHVEVVETQHEPLTTGASDKPGDQRRAQVAHVELTARRRSESTGHRASVAVTMMTLCALATVIE